MSKEKTLSIRTMAVFVAMNFVLSMSGALFNAILDQVAVELNISISQTGMLSSFYAYGAGIGVPVFLVLFRKYDRTILLKVMLLCNIIATGLLLVVSNFPLLILARFLMGLCGNCYGVLATANISALSPKERVGKNIATLITGGASALMIGIPLTRALSHILSWRIIFMMLMALMILSLLYFVFFLPSIGKDTKPLNLKSELAFFKDRQVVVQLLASFITFVGYGAFYMYMTPYIVGMFPQLDGIMSVLLIFVGFCSFSGNLIGGILCDKLGYYKALMIGTMMQIITASLILLTNSIMVVNIGLVLLWMMLGWFIGLQINTGITIVTRNKSSLMISLNSSGIQLGQAIGASIAAMIISSMGISKIIICSIVCSIIVLLGLYINNKEF